MGTDIKNKVKLATENIGHLAEPLQLAFKYMQQNDPSGSLAKSRVVLEKLVLKLFIAEMGKEPKKTELGFILNNNQFTRHIDRRILSRMNAVRDMTNLGAHGEHVLDEDAKETLVNLCRIIDWYHHNQQRLINEAHTFTRNERYEDALQRWKTVLSLDANHTDAKEATATLQHYQQQKQKIKQLRLQLSRRMKDIRSIFNAVVKRLNNLSNSDDDETILVNIEMFVNQELDAKDFIENWEILTNEDTPNTPKTTPDINYKALVGRIQRSELILFLGSGIAQEYNAQPLSEYDIAQQLAENVEQQTLQLPLSSIAEYYDLRNEYGRPLLLRKLHEQLPKQHQHIEFYSSLAQLQRPLLLISTAYDDLLEQAFDQHHKPYIELSAMIHRDHQYDIGSLVLRYSDTDAPATPINEEDLSELNLLEKGYSIIYKMRGTCRYQHHNDHNGNALTLMESDYFRFARYAERMIPSYLGKQFLTRDFLLLGCQPQQWEDRLMLNTLLEKRGGSGKNCLMLGHCNNDFETAYWLKRNVTQHSVSIHHLDQHLKQAQQAS